MRKRFWCRSRRASRKHFCQTRWLAGVIAPEGSLIAKARANGTGPISKAKMHDDTTVLGGTIAAAGPSVRVRFVVWQTGAYEITAARCISQGSLRNSVQILSPQSLQSNDSKGLTPLQAGLFAFVISSDATDARRPPFPTAPWLEYLPRQSGHSQRAMQQPQPYISHRAFCE